MTTVLNPANFRCRMHGKSAFCTREAAEAMIARAYQRRQKTGHDVPRMPKRAYLGECGWWHLAGTHLREGAGSGGSGGISGPVSDPVRDPGEPEALARPSERPREAA